ncbi:MAG: PGF-pre-PGF domain-containing protein [Candidatus Methanoperedenaceae archaeon]|nr:PGF-pre-PGF domain-containing protein [Candidatus Methanoperedenaceae archaeon]
MAEVLKDTSTLVKEAAPGDVYKNINIWVGTSGFATSKNIKEAIIMFRVDNSWIDNKALARSEIKLVRWDGGKWITLETSEKMRDGANTYFEGKTTGFSPFAITGIKEAPSVALPGVTASPTPSTSAATSAPSETSQPINLFIIMGVIVLVALIVAIYLRRK